LFCLGGGWEPDGSSVGFSPFSGGGEGGFDFGLWGLLRGARGSGLLSGGLKHVWERKILLLCFFCRSPRVGSLPMMSASGRFLGNLYRFEVI